jgi:pantothenate kinase-related protein Tda10
MTTPTTDEVVKILEGWFKGQNPTDMTYLAALPPDGYGIEKGDSLRWHLAHHIAKELAAIKPDPKADKKR